MQYQLEEIGTQDLFRELQRRLLALKEFKCPYCNVEVENHTCKFAGEISELYLTPPLIRIAAKELLES